MTSTADLVTNSVADLNGKHEATKKTFKEMTMKERLSYIREVVTVEPLIASYLIPALLCGPAMQYLEFEKSCRANLKLNDTVCDTILESTEDIYPAETQLIQILIGDMHSWQTPLQSVMPLILVLFLGSFSDRHQWRKPFLIIPLVGELFAVIGVIFCVIFMKSWPLEVQGIAQTVVPSFFGGQTMVVMASFSYIADVSSLEMRTLRIGIVQIVLNACTPLVQSFSGVLFTLIGYYGILVIAAVVYTFGILYTYFCIKEPRVPVKASCLELLKDIFDPRHAIETLSLCVKRRPGNNLAYIWIVLFIMFCYSGVTVGEASVAFLYTNNVFRWTPVEFTYFLTTNTLVHLFGTLAGVALFTKIFKLSDWIILIITFVDKIISNIIFGLANSVKFLYVATFVSVFTGITPIGIRSLATKIVSVNDLGKAQSLFGICEAVAPAISTPVYNKLIYIPTYVVFPEAFFYFGAILYTLCTVIICGMYFKDKSDARKVKQDDTTANEKPIQMEDIQITHM